MRFLFIACLGARASRHRSWPGRLSRTQAGRRSHGARVDPRDERLHSCSPWPFQKGGPAVGREGGDETSVVRWQQQGESPGLRSPGIRSRGSGLFAVDGGRAQAGDAEREVLLSKGFVDREEAAGARGSGQVGREPSGGKPGNAPTSSGGSGRELSFWGFSMQLATHGNFWL